MIDKHTQMVIDEILSGKSVERILNNESHAFHERSDVQVALALSNKPENEKYLCGYVVDLICYFTLSDEKLSKKQKEIKDKFKNIKISNAPKEVILQEIQSIDSSLFVYKNIREFIYTEACALLKLHNNYKLRYYGLNNTKKHEIDAVNKELFAQIAKQINACYSEGFKMLVKKVDKHRKSAIEDVEIDIGKLSKTIKIKCLSNNGNVKFEEQIRKILIGRKSVIYNELRVKDIENTGVQVALALTDSRINQKRVFGFVSETLKTYLESDWIKNAEEKLIYDINNLKNQKVAYKEIKLFEQLMNEDPVAFLNKETRDKVRNILSNQLKESYNVYIDQIGFYYTESKRSRIYEKLDKIVDEALQERLLDGVKVIAREIDYYRNKEFKDFLNEIDR